MNGRRGVHLPLVELWAWAKLDEIRSLGCTDVEGTVAVEGDAVTLEIAAVMPSPIQMIVFTGTLDLDEMSKS